MDDAAFLVFLLIPEALKSFRGHAAFPVGVLVVRVICWFLPLETTARPATLLPESPENLLLWMLVRFAGSAENVLGP